MAGEENGSTAFFVRLAPDRRRRRSAVRITHQSYRWPCVAVRRDHGFQRFIFHRRVRTNVIRLHGGQQGLDIFDVRESGNAPRVVRRWRRRRRRNRLRLFVLYSGLLDC